MSDDNQISPEGLEALKAEIQRLEEVERPANADRIRTAREWRDRADMIIQSPDETTSASLLFTFA